MNRRTVSVVTAILMVASVPAAAQWLDVLTKGIPRTKDGKADLSAPAPRKPDGKPDLSGVWQGDMQNLKYLGNLAADFKSGDFPIQPWADALTKERSTGKYDSVNLRRQLFPDTDLLEYVCNENEQDLKHMVGK